jgi:hypothetical protein
MASLNAVHPGDIVEVENRGRKAHCLVTGKRAGELDIKAITPGYGWRTATARQVIGHWRKTKNGRKLKDTGQTAE